MPQRIFITEHGSANLDFCKFPMQYVGTYISSQWLIVPRLKLHRLYGVHIGTELDLSESDYSDVRETALSARSVFRGMPSNQFPPGK